MLNCQVSGLRRCAALALGLASALTSLTALAVPTLTVTATPSPAAVGAAVGVDVLVSGIADLYAFQYTLNFNASVLQAVTVTEGGFLGTAGATFFDGGSIDNSLGAITFTFDTVIGPGAGANGNGVIAHVNFTAAAPGTSTLSFADVLFLDSTSATLNVTAINGTATVSAVPEPAAYALLGAGLAALAFKRRRTAA